jgi:hypothetical protein
MRATWLPTSATASVYRTRSHILRRRVLIGLAGVALLLIGYGIGRWQDTPAPAAVPSPVLSSSSEAPPPSSEPPPPPAPVDYPTVQAEAAAELSGIEKQATTDQGGGENVGWIKEGDYLRFDGIDFGASPPASVELRVASQGGGGGKVEMRIDAKDGPPVATLTVEDTGGWQNWRTEVVKLAPTTGSHTVFVTFARPDGAEFVNLNWWHLTNE